VREISEPTGNILRTWPSTKEDIISHATQHRNKSSKLKRERETYANSERRRSTSSSKHHGFYYFHIHRAPYRLQGSVYSPESKI
jgi:hypothetical protein